MSYKFVSNINNTININNATLRRLAFQNVNYLCDVVEKLSQTKISLEAILLFFLLFSNFFSLMYFNYFLILSTQILSFQIRFENKDLNVSLKIEKIFLFRNKVAPCNHINGNKMKSMNRNGFVWKITFWCLFITYLTRKPTGNCHQGSVPVKELDKTMPIDEMWKTANLKWHSLPNQSR